MKTIDNKLKTRLSITIICVIIAFLTFAVMIRLTDEKTYLNQTQSTPAVEPTDIFQTQDEYMENLTAALVDFEVATVSPYKYIATDPNGSQFNITIDINNETLKIDYLTIETTLLKPALPENTDSLIEALKYESQLEEYEACVLSLEKVLIAAIENNPDLDISYAEKLEVSAAYKSALKKDDYEYTQSLTQIDLTVLNDKSTGNVAVIIKMKY